MRIGELARRAGVGVRTVRFYEQRGLLRQAERSEGGYRVYGEQDVETLATIRQCKTMGLSLQEVAEVLRLFPADPEARARAGNGRPEEHASCLISLRRLGDAKLARLDARLAELNGVRDLLCQALAAIDASLAARRRSPP
jgi:DNA-binding transcriptional MerR regulator